jgi:hypothetical protein
MDGKEKIYFLVNRIIEKDEITVVGSDIRLHPADDLKKKYDAYELTNILKILANHKVIKDVRLPSDDTNWHLMLKTASGFKSYVEKMKQELRYQEFSGTKPKPKMPVLGANSVDLSASSKENEGRTLTAGQVIELYKLDEDKRERIFNEHLTPEHKAEAEKFMKQTQKVVDNFSFPNFEIPVPPLPVGRNQIDVQTDLLRKLVEGNKEQSDRRLTSPTYDKDKRQLIFCNMIIQIPANSDQAELCKALFRSGKPIKKPLDIGDALLKLGVALENVKGNKKISYAKREINERIAKQTQIDDLLVIDSKQIWFNEKYV